MRSRQDASRAKLSRSTRDAFMPVKTSKPGEIHLKIIEVLKRFPKGISGGQLRQELEKEGLRAEEQTHLDRRKRDLKKWFVIEKTKAIQEIHGKQQTVVLYRYAGKRTSVTDPGQIDIKLRAEVIHAAHGRCQAYGCGFADDAFPDKPVSAPSLPERNLGPRQ